MDFNWVHYVVKKICFPKDYFRGIIHGFNDKMKLNKNGFWILFRDNKTNIGHYIAIIEQNKKIYIFDSFGNHPNYYQIQHFDWYSDKQVQPDNTCSCSAFVLFMAKHSINNNPKDVVFHYFASSSKESEKLVLQWLSQYTWIPLNLKICPK